MRVLRRILMPMGAVDAIVFLLYKLRTAKTNHDFFSPMNQLRSASALTKLMVSRRLVLAGPLLGVAPVLGQTSDTRLAFYFRPEPGSMIGTK